MRNTPTPRAGGADMSLHAVLLPSWGCAVHDATYYGYLWGLHLGPWLIFIGKAKP